MTIPKDKIEEVRERASIVQVISDYMPLTKRGHNHVGLCPFHSEKSPSFTVSEQKKIFYCFGCNATGNVITFIMKKEGLTFPEAVRSIARRYGITINEFRKEASDDREGLYAALKAASEYFMAELRTPHGETAREYLKGRGMTGVIAREFKVGFAPNRWDGLVNYLRKNGVSTDTAERAGLIIKRDNSPGFYDRFRNRVVFPITDMRGRVIGFGGRTLDDKVQPKYLNSPESPVFKKGETLYGLSQAKEPIAKEGSVTVVEGYFDLVALHKHGFTNSVATMGTALTPEHIRILKGYATTIYALFDADEAGRSAAIRGLNLFLNEDVSCRAVLLDKGKDPDEFLKLSGPEALREAIKEAPTLMEFYLGNLRGKLNLTAPEGKKKYFGESLAYLSRITDIAERGHYASIVASTLGIGVESVYEALKSPKEGKGLKVRGVATTGNSRPEVIVLRVLVKHPALYSPEAQAAIESFIDPELKEAGRIISCLCREGKGISGTGLLDGVEDPGLKGRMAEMLLREDDGFVEEPERMLQDSIKRVLNRGNIKPSTQEFTRESIKLLEQMGRSEVALEIKKRLEIGSQGKRH
ncbi:MAG TPA: DNA primase [Deltaproteobacteria bacterium]|nr:MAG: DNA primase [Deltaproteobacteria bacterium GWA2_55_82]OGQ65005.1 MAG: DNA primase [Deltaproteobacteria bacterium RIFCSPLOWO2_02_FULL_55_12]OIJ73809.1 MAG: DNA primase [Deltaproteobacteria bacterium GWC2_55_46]HBG45785.1 DNA primase [Deltaproteobacteria bacterium]HCY09796.1 DNA primase [Deltaproteobacteria bacterium]